MARLLFTEVSIPMIQPALTPNEWERQYLIVQAETYGEDDMPSYGQGAAEIHAGPDYLYITEHQYPRYAVIDTPQQRHALAALALHMQPFGFTPRDVQELQMVAEYVSRRFAPSLGILSIAERIAALLPPNHDTP